MSLSSRRAEELAAMEDLDRFYHFQGKGGTRDTADEEIYEKWCNPQEGEKEMSNKPDAERKRGLRPKRKLSPKKKKQRQKPATPVERDDSWMDGDEFPDTKKHDPYFAGLLKNIRDREKRNGERLIFAAIDSDVDVAASEQPDELPQVFSEGRASEGAFKGYFESRSGRQWLFEYDEEYSPLPELLCNACGWDTTLYVRTAELQAIDNVVSRLLKNYGIPGHPESHVCLGILGFDRAVERNGIVYPDSIPEYVTTHVVVATSEAHQGFMALSPSELLWLDACMWEIDYEPLHLPEAELADYLIPAMLRQKWIPGRKRRKTIDKENQSD